MEKFVNFDSGLIINLDYIITVEPIAKDKDGNEFVINMLGDTNWKITRQNYIDISNIMGLKLLDKLEVKN